MSMTREEAAHILEYSRIVSENFTQEAVTATYVMALAALRGPTREQAEKMRGVWSWQTENEYCCTACNNVTCVDECMGEPMYRFCPYCGAPMTDEAVQMVMERLEALHASDT